MKQIQPPTFLLLALVGVALLHLFLPGGPRVPGLWRLLGAIPLVVGLMLNLSADHAFKREGTTVKPLEHPTALLTSGPFRYTRNPMYLGFVLIVAGVALMLGSLAPLLVIPLFWGILDLRFVPPEERALEETFQEEWRAYRSRTRRWL